jgi:low temperature requirement protein LtrA
VNREVLRRLRSDLWRPPRAHGEVLRDRSVGPLELFYDLVVVVLVSQAAHHLARHLTLAGLGQFGAVFAVVWIAWFNGTMHHELHGREDVRGRNTFLGQILLLVPLGAFIPDVGTTHGKAFAIDAALLFAFLAFLWWRAGQGDTAEFATTTRLYVRATLLMAVALAGSAGLPGSDRLWAWGVLAGLYLVAVTVVFAVAPTKAAASLKITDSLIERFGAFVIIVLGETVTGVVTGLTQDPTGATTLAVGLTAILIGFGSWWTYFDFAGNREPRATRSASLLWMLGHLPITAAIAAMGAAMVTLVQHASATRTDAPLAWILSGGAIAVLVFTTAEITCLEAWEGQRRLYRPLAVVCVVASLLAVVAGWLQPDPLVLAIMLVATFAIPWTFAQIRRAQLAVAAGETASPDVEES